MTFWDTIEGFSFHYFEPMEDGPELEPFMPLISVWRSKIQGGYVPSWSDFDFTDFAGWHSKLAIYDIHYDPFDYKVRLSGEQFNQILGRNMKGMTRDDLLAIAVEDKIADAFYEKTCSEMLIAYTKGINIINRQHVDVEFLELPLSDSGDRATQTIETFIRKNRSTFVLPGAD